MEKRKHTAILLDDDEASNYLLEDLLRNNHPEVKIIGAYTDVNAAYRYISEKRPDILFLDIEMPDEFLYASADRKCTNIWRRNNIFK